MLKNSTLINRIDIINLTLSFLGRLNIYINSHWKIKICILVQLLKRCFLKIFDTKRCILKNKILKRCILKINMQNVFYRHKRDKTLEIITILVLSHNYSLFLNTYNFFYSMINSVICLFPYLVRPVFPLFWSFKLSSAYILFRLNIFIIGNYYLLLSLSYVVSQFFIILFCDSISLYSLIIYNYM